MNRSASTNTRFLGVACIALLTALTAACTATTTSTGDGSSPAGSSAPTSGNENGGAAGTTAGASGGGAGQGSATSTDGPALSCDAVALCSSYWVSGTAAPLPARTGGTIADGRYSLVDLLSPKTAYDSLREVLVVRGGSYRATGNLGGGGLGSLKAENGKLALAKSQYCRTTGEPSTVLKDADVSSYDYAVDGDRLYVFDDTSFSHAGDTEPVALVYQRFDGDLCQSPGASTCTIKKCFCASKVGGTLADATCNPNP